MSYNEERDEDATIIEKSTAFFEYKSYRNLLSMHEILHFSSPEDAKGEFDAQVEHDASAGFSLFLPPEISPASQTANRTSIQCFNAESEIGLIIRCNVYAQYGSYLSVFAGPIGDRIMNYKDFNKVVQEIDRKMNIIVT